MQRRIYVENDYDGLYGHFWSHLGELCGAHHDFLANPQSFDLVCFTGGEDVSPELYQHKNLMSGNSKRRDDREREVFDMASQWKIPMTGICRGSQFLNVMMGGTMVQHLRSSHGGSPHMCRTKDGLTFPVTSSHHQMSVLTEGGILIGWADEEVPVESLVYDGNPRNALRQAGNLLEEDMCLVTEAFAYPAANIFACQFHAEWMSPKAECWQWQLRKTREYCFGEKEESGRSLERKSLSL